eukprot:m51a1_g1893 hypothetical protein (177) ;mRNA; r:744186-745460
MVDIQQFMGQLAEQEEGLRQADARLAAEATRSRHLGAQLDDATERLRAAQQSELRAQEQLQLAQAQRDSQAKLNEELRRDLRLAQEELERMAALLKEGKRRADRDRRAMAESVDACNQRMREALDYYEGRRAPPALVKAEKAEPKPEALPTSGSGRAPSARGAALRADEWLDVSSP